MAKRILIAGAGIGGLTAAACLIKAGHSVRIFEQAPELTEIGAGIQMSANAMKVLDLDVRHSPLGIRSRIGYMPESDAHIPGMNAVSFVAYCGKVGGMGDYSGGNLIWIIHNPNESGYR